MIKNAETLYIYIYQRAMNYIFHELDSKIVEIYIDDVVVKSKGYKEHLVDLRKNTGVHDKACEYQQVCLWYFSCIAPGFLDT
jgi:hypothetical protein